MERASASVAVELGLIASRGQANDFKIGIQSIKLFLFLKKKEGTVEHIYRKRNSSKGSECGLPNDHFGRLTSVTLVLIIKNKLGSAQVPKFGRLLVKIDSSASSP